jgi:FixJ family two-component response regulator
MDRDPVFVVDGDPAVRDSLSTLLDLNGYAVETCSTGAAFLDYLREGVKMRCVVCESDLPDGSGIQVFRSVRATDGAVPFVLLLSRRNPSAIQSARKAGIESIFSKPLVHRRLIEYIGSAAT